MCYYVFSLPLFQGGPRPKGQPIKIALSVCLNAARTLEIIRESLK
jgi:hypothetical protein